MTLALVEQTTEREASMRSLMSMLTYARPAGSASETAFIRAFIEPLGVNRDGAGNLIKRIGTAPVLWSCHTDTVHKTGGRQDIATYDGTVGLMAGSTSSCLGADDTAGVWLMSEMILANVPGLYIFHRAEEIGGIGSRFIADKTPALLSGIDYAIALDRKGTGSVITHQMGRCCSDAFAVSLAAALGGQFVPDDTGLFTDTANYTGLIGECTNLSVGYEKAHSAKEWLDVDFLFSLRDTLIHLDHSAIVLSREAGEEDPDDDTFDPYAPADIGDRWSPLMGDMERLCGDHPDVIADFLEGMGVDVEEIKAVIRGYGRPA